MKIDLTGQTALVTASSGGIGFAVAVGLARAGAHTVINGRSDESVQQAIARIREAVPGAVLSGVAADLESAEGAAKITKAVPSVDILVNNAGIYQQMSFFDIDDAEWERYFQTNVMSSVRLSRHYMKGMLERNQGRVLFMSSESALNIPPDMLHYGMTKTALLSISRGLAKLAAGSAVTVNAILPGPTASDGFVTMLKGVAEKEGKTIEQAGIDFVKAHRPSSILQRPATVEEVANLVVYVSSPQASATTGAALRVDGGVVDSIV